MTIQLERMAWSQPDGEDMYTPTRDLIATPAVFALEPGSTQTLRITPRERSAEGAERAFRIYVREVPMPSESGEPGVRVALRIGVPVFVGQSGNPGHPRIQLTTDAEGKARLRIHNPGPRYLRVLEAEARTHNGQTVLWRTDTPAYVVSGSTREWTEPVLTTIAPGQLLDLKVRTESGLFENTVAAAR